MSNGKDGSQNITAHGAHEHRSHCRRHRKGGYAPPAKRHRPAGTTCPYDRSDELPRELPRLFRRRARPAAFGAALSRVRRPGTHRRALSARHLAFAGGAEERRDLVLERLPRHGPASESHRRHGGDRDPDGHRRRRHPQHRRQQSSAGRAGARACRFAPQGSRTGLHLRLCFQRRPASPRWRG